MLWKACSSSAKAPHTMPWCAFATTRVVAIGAKEGGGCEARPGGTSQCYAYGLAEANEKCRDSTSVACIVPGGRAEEFARERKKWLPDMP